jgi:hypothetical protein
MRRGALLRVPQVHVPLGIGAVEGLSSSVSAFAGIRP